MPHFSLTVEEKWMATLRKGNEQSRLVVGRAQWNEGKARKRTGSCMLLEMEGVAEVSWPVDSRCVQGFLQL